MAVFWVAAPCSLIEVYQCFRGPCCLAAATQKAAIFIMVINDKMERRRKQSWSILKYYT
jgi:hypothetical protein